MPDNFIEAQGRVHNTKPMGNDRNVDIKNLVNGVGVVEGFYVKVTAPISQSVYVSRGIAVGPDGAEIRSAPSGVLSEQAYRKALVEDFSLVDASAVIGTTLDPGTHALLFTLDATKHQVKVHKITTAEKAAIEAAISAVGDEATSAFDAATADHDARGKDEYTSPDTFAAADYANEYVLATAQVDGVGGDIDAVVVKREQRVAFADMSL